MKKIEIMSPVPIWAFQKDIPEGVTVASSGRNRVAMSSSGRIWEGIAVVIGGGVPLKIIGLFIENSLKRTKGDPPTYIEINNIRIHMDANSIEKFLDTIPEENGGDKKPDQPSNPPKP